MNTSLPGRNTPVLLHLNQTDSTNLALLRLKDTPLPDGYAIMANYQTAGRGRLGRSWSSKHGANLLVSYWLRLNLPAAQVAGFSLLPSLAVLDMLDSYGIQAGCKWPNDIRVSRRKLCGILTKLVSGPGRVQAGAIVGIGLNILDAPLADGGGPPPICLADLACTPPPPEELALALRGKLMRRAAAWRAGQRRAQLGDWLARCDHLNDIVTVTIKGQKREGIMRGLGDQGQLLFEQQGIIREVWADDVVVNRT